MTKRHAYYSVKEAVEAIGGGIEESEVLEAIADDELPIPVLRVDDRIVIPAAWLEAWIDAKVEQERGRRRESP